MAVACVFFRGIILSISGLSAKGTYDCTLSLNWQRFVCPELLPFRHSHIVFTVSNSCATHPGMAFTYFQKTSRRQIIKRYQPHSPYTIPVYKTPFHFRNTGRCTKQSQLTFCCYDFPQPLQTYAYSGVTSCRTFCFHNGNQAQQPTQIKTRSFEPTSHNYAENISVGLSSQLGYLPRLDTKNECLMTHCLVNLIAKWCLILSPLQNASLILVHLESLRWLTTVRNNRTRFSVGTDCFYGAPSLGKKPDDDSTLSIRKKI